VGFVARRAAGELEAEVLTTLWAAEKPLTAAEVHADHGGELAMTTIVTILGRLAHKGMVKRTDERDGRAYRYAPTRERAEDAAERMYAFLGDGAERRAVLARFLGRLSAAERRAALDLLGRRSR
jgi:predicted transcriptional regulator